MSRLPLQPSLTHTNRNQHHTYYPIIPQKTNPNPNPNTNHAPTPKHHSTEVEALRKSNIELREREEMYIQKLMKLETGLQNQHADFIKLQQLYSELYDSYRQKETEIIELELKYRETERSPQQHNLDGSRETQTQGEESFRSEVKPNEYSFKEMSLQEDQWEQRQKEWMAKQAQWKEKEKELTQYIDSLTSKITVNNQTHEKIFQQLKNKEKILASKVASEKSLQEIKDLQLKLDTQHENRLKFQYQNQFLRSRNADLETQRDQLEKLITHKQKEINKLREEKIKIHRQGSEKCLQRSPSASQRKPLPNRPTFVQTSISSEMSSHSEQYFSFSGQGGSFDCAGEEIV